MAGRVRVGTEVVRIDRDSLLPLALLTPLLLGIVAARVATIGFLSAASR